MFSLGINKRKTGSTARIDLTQTNEKTAMKHIYIETQIPTHIIKPHHTKESNENKKKTTENFISAQSNAKIKQNNRKLSNKFTTEAKANKTRHDLFITVF